VVVSQSLAEVVGQNCERLRSQIGITQDELAQYARDLGLRWKASAVGDFEAGRSAPKFSTLVTLAVALQWALEDAGQSDGRPTSISLADLMVSDGWVMLTDTFKVSGKFLANACRGHAVTLESPMYDSVKIQGAAVDAVADILRQAGLTEHRQAKRLGIDPSLLAALSLKLWQKTFSEERDHRAGPDANQQKRGQVTRALQAELADALAAWRHGGDVLAQPAETKVWADGNDQ
jgi:DNA-binding XRE family transcriptional regulator